MKLPCPRVVSYHDSCPVPRVLAVHAHAKLVSLDLESYTLAIGILAIYLTSPMSGILSPLSYDSHMTHSHDSLSRAASRV